MPIKITMLQTRRGEDGTPWVEGSTYVASDAFGIQMISSNLATGQFTPPLPSSIGASRAAALASLVPVAGRVNAAQRMFGNTAASTSAFVGTRIVKMEAEAPFDAVRLHFYNRLLVASNTYKCIVAATETAELTSVAVAGQPTVGGAQTAALRSAVGQPGWAPVTFGGAGTGNIAAAVDAQTPTVLSSDWVELPSVPRADGGTRPLLMLRCYRDAATQGGWNSTGGLTTDTSPDQTAWQNASAYPWWRQWQGATISTTDAVAAPATNLPFTTLANSSMWVAMEFGYRVRALSVMGIGDSLTENSTFTWGSFGSWGMRGCMLASTPQRPITWFQGGMSGQANSKWIVPGEADVALHKPTHCVYQLLSPNTPDVAAISTLTAAEAALMQTRLQRISRVCRDAGTRLVVVSAFPNSGYTLASDTFRKGLNATAQLMAASGAFDYLDMEDITSNGASPAAWASQYDNVHPNNAMLDLISYKLRDYLRTQAQ